VDRADSLHFEAGRYAGHVSTRDQGVTQGFGGLKKKKV